jgi:transposase
MRGDDPKQAAMFSYLTLAQRIPADHPARQIRVLVDRALERMDAELEKLYSDRGRPSIAPERLLRATLLMILFSVRSERQLMEQMDYNLLFRWFVGLEMDDAVWDVTVFTKNRERLLEGEIAEAFFEQVIAQARAKELLSDEHFTVDGTLIQAWAGQKSFRAKNNKDAKDEVPPDDPGNVTVDFRGEKRSNATHESTTDPQARLYKKSAGSEAKLSYLGHVLTENRNGLVVGARVTKATGTAEREAALEMIEERKGGRRVTMGGDKGYDVQEFVADVRDLGVTPHVAQNNGNRRSAVDERTTRHAGYEISQRKRKRVEEVFGWLKTIGLMRQTRHRGRERVSWMFTFAAAVYNLVRIRNLTAAAA